MSSSIDREPLSGVIHQDKQIVGAICLPEEDLQEFIEQFNHCYGPVGLRIVPPAFIAPTPPAMVLPVGATHRNPYREPSSVKRPPQQ